MFFFLGAPNAELSDASAPLIDTYRAVRSASDRILAELQILRPTRETFDFFRGQRTTTPTEHAVRFILLNKACWNGLYRVNSKGEFNVPYGRPKTDFVINAHHFRQCASLLKRRSVSIRRQDFESISSRVGEGDFVFLDPPYVTRHNLNGFAEWNQSLFSWDDQIRLAVMARTLAHRGANVLITNADHQDIRDLYVGFHTATFTRYSTLASDATKRTATTEAVFFAGPWYESPEAQPNSNQDSIECLPP